MTLFQIPYYAFFQVMLPFLMLDEGVPEPNEFINGQVHLVTRTADQVKNLTLLVEPPSPSSAWLRRSSYGRGLAVGNPRDSVSSF